MERIFVIFQQTSQIKHRKKIEINLKFSKNSIKVCLQKNEYLIGYYAEIYMTKQKFQKSKIQFPKPIWKYLRGKKQKQKSCLQTNETKT